MSPLHGLVEPTAWVETPTRFSFSSLSAIERCPRRWQLIRSAWGEHSEWPERTHPSALEGRIVHAAIDRLFRALARRGRPDFATDAFRQAVDEVHFWQSFADDIERCNAALATHPLPGAAFRIRTPPAQLANRAIRLLRARYRPAGGSLGDALDAPPHAAVPDRTRSRGSLALDPLPQLRRRGLLGELRLTHPTLPLTAVLDLVEHSAEGTRIIDFKTGDPSEAHVEQLRWYAVVWWRRTGERPSRLVLQGLDGQQVIDADEETLLDAEARMRDAIADARRQLDRRPAVARPGPACGGCAVRARCDEGWASLAAARGGTTPGLADLEVVVPAPPAAAGFVGDRDGEAVDIVYDAPVGARWPSLREGARLRLLDGWRRDDGSVEIRAWTEVFEVAPTPSVLAM